MKVISRTEQKKGHRLRKLQFGFLHRVCTFPSQRTDSSDVTDSQKSPTHLKTALDFMQMLEFQGAVKHCHHQIP